MFWTSRKSASTASRTRSCTSSGCAKTAYATRFSDGVARHSCYYRRIAGGRLEAVEN